MDTTTAPRKSRSGSNKRRRHRQVKLSLLPHEELELQQRADDEGYHNVQAYILDKLQLAIAT